MKVLIAPNAFKGTIEADEAAFIIRDAILVRYPDAEIMLGPIADGGDGTCYLLGKALALPQISHVALDPLGRPVKGFFSLDPNSRTAYLDVSTVSGIKNLRLEYLNPWISSSYGTGELIKLALEARASHIVLGLGGSATMDMGLGILRALGYLFLDEKGREITLYSEGFIKRISHIQRPFEKPGIRFTCLCDVNNYFFGEEGAIPVFGPQKGLKADEIPEYEKSCKRICELLEKKSLKKITDQPGFGAAGGIALGLSAFFPTEVRMGAQWFFDKSGMEANVRNADLVITGEGKYDGQSAGGKGSFELLQLAKSHHKKIVLITSGSGAQHAGFDAVYQLPDLDFNHTDFKEKAKANLSVLVEKEFKINL